MTKYHQYYELQYIKDWYAWDALVWLPIEYVSYSTWEDTAKPRTNFRILFIMYDTILIAIKLFLYYMLLIILIINSKINIIRVYPSFILP